VLGAVRGRGQGAARAISAERAAGGKFATLGDFFTRVSAAGMHQRQAEMLALCGALDSLCANRAAGMQALPGLLAAAAQAARDAEWGQEGLFDDGGASPEAIEIPDTPDWSARERLDGERRSLGFCLSGHPFDEFRDEAGELTGGSLRAILDRARAGTLERNDAPAILAAGSVLRKWRRAGANFFDLDDGETRLPVRLPRWDSGALPAGLITPHSLVLVKGRLARLPRGSLSLFADSVESLDDVMDKRAQELLLRCAPSEDPREAIAQLRRLLKGHAPGNAQVVIQHSGPGAAGRLRLGDGWKVRASESLRQALRQSPAVQEFEFRYARRA